MSAVQGVRCEHVAREVPSLVEATEVVDSLSRLVRSSPRNRTVERVEPKDRDLVDREDIAPDDGRREVRVQEVKEGHVQRVGSEV